MKKQVTFWIDDDIRRKFSAKYTRSMSEFLRNCIIRALNDKNFFKDFYFLNIDDKEGNEKNER